MSAIAGVLSAMGHDVSGSDAADSTALRRARVAGVNAYVGHAADKIPAETEVVAVSTAIASDNVEVVEAAARSLPVLRRADLLASIAATRQTIAVAGTHGKTTTSTLVALVLEAGGVQPSWVIGGEVLGRGSGAHWDSGKWFVVEADESDGTFLELGAEAVVVTNVEPDHLEHYGSWANLQTAFDTFVESASKHRVVCIDDVGAALLAERFEVATYGQHEKATYRIVDVRPGRFGASFGVEHQGSIVPIEINAPGLHNVRNATAALAMGHLLGVPLAVGANGIANYQGVGRRFQRRGERNGISFVDDYAHLPGEVAAALAAARDGEWNRVVAVFQPHRYSRTQQVGADFGGAFDFADLLVLADVYAAGEAPRAGIDGTIVERAVLAEDGHPPVTYVEDRAVLASEVAALLQPGDLCITLGAGDITKLADEIIELL